MTKSGHVLLLGVPGGIAQSMFLHSMLNADVYLSLIIAPGIDIDEKLLSRINEVIIADINNIAVCLYHAQELHKKLAINGVTTFMEDAIETAAVIKTSLNINGLELLPTLLTKYKNMMREHLKEVCPELAIPYKKIHSKNDIKDFLNEINAPFILKPAKGVNSRGVLKITSESQIDKLDIEFANTNYLAELYIEGDCVYNAETITFNGKHHLICIGQEDFSTTRGSYIFTDNTMPAQDLSWVVIDAITKKITMFLDAINLSNGVAHTEIKICKDRVYIIESQLRIGGACIWYMAEKYTGYPQIEMYTRSLAGKSVIEPKAFNDQLKPIYRIYKILPEYSGVLREIRGVDVIKSHPQVVYFNLFEKEGNNIVCDNYDLLEIAQVVFKGENLAAIEQSKSELAGVLRFIYQDGSVQSF